MMRVFFLGIAFSAISIAAPAQCPPDSWRAMVISTDVELRTCADAVRILVCVTRWGAAAELWKREADDDHDGIVTKVEAGERVTADRAILCEYGLLLEIEEGARRVVRDLRLENCASEVGVDHEDSVRIQFDFVARDFVPIAGREYSGSLTVANPFNDSVVLHHSATAGDGVNLSWEEDRPPLLGMSRKGSGCSSRFSFVVAAEPARSPAGRKETDSASMQMLFAGALLYFGVLAFATRRR